MDDADHASIAARHYFQVSMLNQKRQSGLGGNTSRWCQDCGKEIPKKRRDACKKAGLECTRCITCKTELERSPRG